MNFWEQIWCVLSEEMSFVTFTRIWPHVNENEKKKSKKLKIKKKMKKKWCGDMVEREQPKEFGLHPCSRF